MSSPKIEDALTVRWPSVNSSADTTGVRNVIFRYTNTNTSSNAFSGAPIPIQLRGRYWRFACTTNDVEWGWLIEGDTAPTLVYGQLCTPGTGAAGSAPHLFAGVPEHVRCPDKAYGLIWISGGTTGIFEASHSGRSSSGYLTGSNY